MSPTTNRIAVVDCQSAGVSGDMILGALLDLGADFNKIDEAMKYVRDSLDGCKDLQLFVEDVMRSGFRAKRVDFRIDEDVRARSGRELRDGLHKSLNQLKLSDEAVQLATKAMDTLIKAEESLHGAGDHHEVHLHEAGSADTIADIVGVVVALEDLNLTRDTKIYSTPVAVGGGLLTFSHGTVSTPAPATLEILRSKSFPIIGGPVEFELATPTGVSLLTNMTNMVSSYYPTMKPVKVGYGAGAKDHAGTANILRIVVGEPFEHTLANDEIYVLETNLDDVSGEVIGHTVDRLLEEGAKDVSVIPMFTKKNRPGQILKVISEERDAENLVRVLADETGTLGIREYRCRRQILIRETKSIHVTINDKSQLVRLKIAKDLAGNVIQVKPEYDDIKRMARETGMPYRNIIEIVSRSTAQSLTEKQLS
jgi:uncharacterized protein (TIGR00299 family) protein